MWRSFMLIIGLSLPLICVPVSSTSASTIACVWSREVNETEKATRYFQQMVAEGYSISQGPVCSTAHLGGPIDKGDAARLEAFIVANLPFLTSVELNSRGGNLAESMKIGRLVRRFYLATRAPEERGSGPSWLRPEGRITEPGAVCASACFFVWLGGISRTGDLIGIHRPFPPVAEMQRMSPAEADQMYRDVSSTIRAYLVETGTAPHWLDDMMNVGSDDISLLSKQQMAEFSGSQNDGDVPSIAQWKSAQCGSLSNAEYNDFGSFILLDLKKIPTPRSQRSYRESLMHRWGEIIQCGAQALILARWRAREAG
jgi:hypothetical protein